ncbi:hypothetical protein H6758_03135 [Candidatus Nomurabacteria bacterium]|nr:hypothetical protein [Candidatus Nomurabacteria bacterium]
MFFTKKELKNLDQEQLYEVREAYLTHMKNPQASKFQFLQRKPVLADMSLVDDMILQYAA